VNKKVFVTGAAGFIGSNLVDRLLEEHDVIGLDNFATGTEFFLTEARKNPNFKLIRVDATDLKALKEAMAGGGEMVYHLCAHADVRVDPDHPDRELQQNTIATFNVLEAMRANGIGKIAFASTGSVYGDAKVIPTPEDAPFPIQTSLYGASKLAGEGMIAGYCENYNFQGWIFRFVSILGERYTHGHVFDFYKRLTSNPEQLTVLGNGHQKKSYLYIQDCINAIFCAVSNANDRLNIFNLGTDEYCEVRDSIGWITEHLKLKPEIVFGSEQRGWIGDNPFIYLDTSKIRGLGWKSELTIKDSVIRTLDYLQANQNLLTRNA
jgi:UDP-glucose 4-epimerase